MCDCGCLTTTDETATNDNSGYDNSTYDITGNPIDYTYQAPAEVAPVEVAPVEVAPVETAPVDVAPVETFDPMPSTNDQLIDSLNTLPAGSPTADVITSVLLQPGKDAAKWFEPTHDIYGNSL